MAAEFVRYLFERGFDRGHRSIVLTTLLTMGGMLLGSLVVTGVEHAPTWMQVFLAALTTVDFGIFAWAYVYFVRSNPEALRSEQFLTQKLAIERGMLGDQLSGVMDANVTASLPRTIEEEPRQIEGEE
jgi:hypothetical protein